jgi:hypothetical protein
LHAERTIARCEAHVLSRRLNDAMKSPIAGKWLLAFSPPSPPQDGRQLLLFATIFGKAAQRYRCTLDKGSM